MIAGSRQLANDFWSDGGSLVTTAFDSSALAGVRDRSGWVRYITRQLYQLLEAELSVDAA
jgi:tRNA G26 N,N-dimethylase Trm1